VRGPGTGTSDSIPAWLSNGEAVITALATANNPRTVAALLAGLDVDGLLAGVRVPPLRIPVPRVPRYASGGLVSAAAVGSGGGRGGTLEGRLDVGLAPGLVAQAVEAYLRTSDGERLVVQTTINNRRTIAPAIAGAAGGR
jgi:hypothetical protein